MFQKKRINGSVTKEENHHMVIGNSVSASPVTFDTDPEDEGVNLSDMDEDTEIELSSSGPGPGRVKVR